MTDLTALCGAVLAAFIGGLAVGLMWRIFRDEDRDSSRRLPRPGEQSVFPDSKVKSWGRSGDMLQNGRHKKE